MTSHEPARFAAEVIRTPRLDLTPLSVDDADVMAVVLADPALHAYIGGTPESPEELGVRYRRLAAGSPDPGISWLNWIVRLRDEGCATGFVQATVDGRSLTAELAWVIGTPWQGRGIAREAAVGLVGRLGDLGIRAVVAHIHPEHRASAAVAEAAGLSATEVLEDGEVRWVGKVERRMR
ncbi:GNAT family N-acetyltransferase [Yinghuangia aomiensis]|uniref:GNAT family N-acetyltransferase n=1 Tax=Yinghuangia aomiensis TaxID=676205 RepID=A0ABP9I681_9ACTN